MVITVGSKVRIKSNSNEGIVVEVKDNFAKVLADSSNWYPLEELEDVSSQLVNRFIRNDLDDCLDFILAVDAFRLSSEHKFNPYVLASSTKIDIYPHQIDEVLKIIDNPRMMVADEVGLGKTIVAALVASELNTRGIADRMLFVVPKALLRKWQDELRDRFEIDAKIVTSEYVKVNGNPFKEREFAYIASMDYLKQDDVKKMIEGVDLVVVDEAHKFAIGTDRLKLGENLAPKTNFMLLLTATPHNGDDNDFLARIKLLDPYIMSTDGSTHLVIRNMKEDVIDLDGKEVFPPRESKTIEIPLSEEEEKIRVMLDNYLATLSDRVTDKREEGAVRFLSTIFRKRASSSPYALKRSLENRLLKLGKIDKDKMISNIDKLKESEEEFDEESYETYEGEVVGYTPERADRRFEEESIKSILNALKNLKRDSKLENLLDWIKKIKEGDKDAKIVIFTEYRDTLQYIKSELSKHYRVQSIDGSMSIDERINALNNFRLKDEIIVCTDAAGEGIDMQFSNIEINYDLPWNPTRLEQRMGRIHRIGQKRKAFYYNFILDPERSIDGYILSRLFDKIESIKQVLKDKVYDIIGKLVDENEIIKLYEELLKAPREEWEAKIKDLERSIDEKSRILEDINRLLSANKFDRTKLEDMRKVIRYSVDKNEVRRFVEVFIHAKKGSIEAINDNEEFYRIYLPLGMAYKDKSFDDGSFSIDVAMSKGCTYFALGNRFVMLMVNESRKSSVSVLTHKTLKGLLLVYMLTIKDSKGRERAGKVVTFLVNDGQVNEIDPRSIWDFECSNDKPKIDTSTLIQTINMVNSSHVTSLLDRLHADTRKRLDGIKEKTLEVINNYYSTKISELNNKIEDYKERLTEAPHFTKLIEGTKRDIYNLREEWEGKRRAIEDEFNTYPVLELVGIAEVINEDGSDLRRKVELAGMEKVLEHEKNRASSEEERRKIKDVSNMLTGYDIESFDRVIEVKSFKESGAIELTSHEWLTANKMEDEYWIYVVEDALGEGKISPIQNPAVKFKDKVKRVPITDYKYIIEDWKEFKVS